MDDVLNKKLSELGFSNRLYNALTRRPDSFYFTAPRTLGDLVTRTPKEILRFGGIGAVLLKELDEKLAAMGLSLTPDERPLKQYRVEKTPEEIAEKANKEEQATIVKLHRAIGKLMLDSQPRHCFIALISVLGQLVATQFPEDEWENVLARFYTDTIKMADLLNSLMKEKEAAGSTSTVH